MNKELEGLLKTKEQYNKWLERADERNDLISCMEYTKILNDLDKQIREIATEKELEELHIKGLI